MKPADIRVHALTIKAKGGRLRDIKSIANIGQAFNIGDKEPELNGFQAIWDTGATGTCVSQNVIDKCGLMPIGMTEMHTAQGSMPTEVYLICLQLPGGVGFTQLRVSKVNLTGADVLIGMDVITEGDFAVTNKGGETVVSFRYPSLEHIDFMEKSKNQSDTPLGGNRAQRRGNKEKLKRRR